MIPRLIGAVLPTTAQLGGIYAFSRFFPVTSGLVALCLIPAKGWLGIVISMVVSVLALTIGDGLVPEYTILSQSSRRDDLWLVLFMFMPGGAAAIKYKDFGNGLLHGYVAGSAAIAIAMILNGLGVFGSSHIYAGAVAVAISGFMLCGYKVRSHFKWAVTVAVLLLPVFCVGHSLSLAMSGILAAFLLVAVLIGLRCLPSKAEVDLAWEDEVLKLAVATKWNNEMWPAIESYLADHLECGHAFESLPRYTEEDFTFMMGEFDEVSNRTRDLMLDMMLSLFNRRWDDATLACTWNNMIDERDPMLKPESASFKSLRKLPVLTQRHEY